MRVLSIVIIWHAFTITCFAQINLNQNHSNRVHDYLVQEGIQEIENKNFKKASKLLKKAVKKDIINSAGSYFLGISLNNTWRSNHKKQEKAIASFTDAIKYDIMNPKYFFRRGLCYHGMFSHYRLAIVDFDRAIDLNPTIPEYYFYRATARLSLLPVSSELKDIAALALKDLIKFDSIVKELNDVELMNILDLVEWGHYHQAIAYQVLGDYEQAIEQKTIYDSKKRKPTYEYSHVYSIMQSFNRDKTGLRPSMLIFPVGVHPMDLRVGIRKKS